MAKVEIYSGAQHAVDIVNKQVKGKILAKIKMCILSILKKEAKEKGTWQIIY